MPISLISYFLTQDAVGDGKLRPGGANWRTRRNIRVVSNSANNLSIMWKHDVIHKTGSTLHIVQPPKANLATAKGNVYKKFGEIWTCGFWDVREDRQTDRQTDRPTYRHADHNISNQMRCRHDKHFVRRSCLVRLRFQVKSWRFWALSVDYTRRQVTDLSLTLDMTRSDEMRKQLCGWQAPALRGWRHRAIRTWRSFSLFRFTIKSM